MYKILDLSTGKYNRYLSIKKDTDQLYFTDEFSTYQDALLTIQCSYPKDAQNLFEIVFIKD